MADSTYQAGTGVYRAQGGKELHLGAEGVIAENTPVNATAATLAVTAASHGGKVITLNRAAGITATLPAATGSGVEFRFFVGTTVTSNANIIQVTTDDVMVGNLIANSTGDTPDLAQPWPTAVDSDTITLNGTTTGGIKGDYIWLCDVAADTWAVQGVINQSGVEATPFSAAVA